MKRLEETRAPRISGIDVLGETVEVDYSMYLMNILLFFEPVSKHSIDSVEQVRLISTRYEKLSTGFWYVMEPRLSCMLHSEAAKKALDRMGIFDNILFDPNNMIALQSGVQTVPTVFVVDSNGFLNSRYEGEISWVEIERNIQGRVAQSGYREELPPMPKPGYYSRALRSASVMRQMGYASGDYVFSSAIVPESDQQFSLPNFYLLNTIYPFGAWYVSRDFIEGKSGSTLYISCAKDESVYLFAGSEGRTLIRLHTSIESTQHVSLGKDVKSENGAHQLEVDDYQPYELISNTGDSDVLVSLQVMSGSLQLFAVEFCPQAEVFSGVNASRPARP